MIISLSACGQNIFEKSEILMATYKLNNATKIQVFDMGHGSTSPEYIEIRKNGFFHTKVIKRIDENPVGTEVRISRVNDTLFKVIFIDTTIFKGHSRYINFIIK